MANLVQKLGDNTTKEVKPDFEGAKAHYWMKQVDAARRVGVDDNLPRKPRATLAEQSFFDQVDRRLSRRSIIMGVSFDKDGRIVRE